MTLTSITQGTGLNTIRELGWVPQGSRLPLPSAKVKWTGNFYMASLKELPVSRSDDDQNKQKTKQRVNNRNM